MKDPEHDPEQAALDELMEAFAEDPATGEIEEILIVEQDPLPAPDDPSPADAVPDAEPDDEPDDGPDDVSGESVERSEPARVIRIDDYSGSSELPASSDDRDDPGDRDRHGRVDAAAPPAGEPVVIAIDDEELPNTVYVEGSLDRDGSRSIVFIEDDDTGDTLAPESERDLRRGIEPRMRERRVAIKRAAGRKRLKWLAGIAFVLFVVVGVLALLGSSLFAVREDQVTVTGNIYTDSAALDAILDDLIGTPVLLVDSQDIEKRIEEIPWVDEARVRTSFPHAATIEIRERQAMTTYKGPDSRFRVLDRDGRVLDVIDLYPLAYVLLGGPDPVDLEAGEIAPSGYSAASELVKNLPPSVRGQVEIIEVASDGSRLVMRLTDGTEVRFGEARDLFAKLVRLETVLSSTEAREPGVIDVSTREVIM